MLRSLTSLATSWSAYRLLRQDKIQPYMDESTAKKWAACVPIWMEKLPTLSFGHHKSWVRNLYRHGHKISQDPTFWKALQHLASDNWKSNLESLMLQAGLFNNPMPFLHFDPYEDKDKNVFGDVQLVTGMVQYMRATFNHGTHPQLGRKLEELSATPTSWDLGVYNLPIRAKDTLFPTRPGGTENYWRFFSGDNEFPIEILVDYYKSMMDLNPSNTAYASWAHAAWDARRTKPALGKDGHWGKFETQIGPLYDKHIDWDFIAACHGFLRSTENPRNVEVAAYAQDHFAVDAPPVALPTQRDLVALGMLSLREPTCPWEVYTLFVGAPSPETPIESYPFDFK